MTSSTSSSEPLVSPPPPYARTRPLAVVLALALPAAVVAATLGWWGRPEVDTGEPSVALAACRATMEKTRPDVVIVGNSKAGTDIDKAALSAALGARVAGVGMPATGGHVWYAMLERCIFETATPRLVIVYGTLGSALRATVRGDNDRNGLLSYEAASLPAIQEKVLGATRGPLWERVDRRQGELRTDLQHLVRDGVAGLFFAPPGDGGLLDAGRAYAEPALAKVLGADATADVERSRAIPIADAAEKGAVAADATVADSLLPDMIAAARARGVRFVFARAPLAEWKVSYDAIPTRLAREAVEVLNAEGVGYLDLTTGRYPASAFGDGIHLNAGGRATLTRALADGLVQLDALGAGAFPAAALPRVAPVASRVGTIPTLPALAPERAAGDCAWKAALPELMRVSDSALFKAGLGAVSPVLVLEDGEPLAPHAAKVAFADTCAGAFTHQGQALKFSPSAGPVEAAAGRAYTAVLDPAVPQDANGREAWWVYPGTSVRLDVPDAWDDAGAFRVGVVAHVAVPGAGVPEVTVTGATAAPLTLQGTDAVAILDVPAPADAWTVEIRSPADGPWLLIQHVAAGDAARPWYMIGAPERARTLALLGGDAAYTNANPLPTIPLTTFKPGGGKMWIAPETAALGAPSAGAVMSVAGIPGCSFLRVAEDGTPLPGPNAGLSKVRAEGGGNYLVDTFGVGLSTPDGTSPADNGRAYTTSLDPTRACVDARWLYPGDHAAFTLDAERVARTLRGGVTTLDIAANVFARPDAAADAALTVRLRVDDVVVLEDTVPLATLAERPPEWTLPAPVAGPVVLELATPPGAPWVFVTSASLVEPGRPAFPEAEQAAIRAEPAAPPTGATTRGASAP